MSNSTRVWVAQTFFDDDRNKGFAFAPDAGISAQEAYQLAAIGDDYSPRRHAGTWVPREVIGDVTAEYDFAMLHGVLPALSARAVAVLRDVLEPNGELLPLVAPESAGRDWYFYNVTRVVDCLDAARSELTYFYPSRTHASHIRTHVFVEEAIRGLSIFRVPQLKNHVYLTDAVARRVREAGLYGFELAEVWPLPPGEYWWNRYKAQSAESFKAWKAARRSRGRKPAARTKGAAAPSKRKPKDAVPELGSRALRDTEVAELTAGLSAAEALVGLQSGWDDAHAAMAAAEREAMRLRDEPPGTARGDGQFAVSILIGEALVRALPGWGWRMISSGSEETLGVVDGDGTLAVPVFAVSSRLINDDTSDVALVLLLSMVAAGRFERTPGRLKLIG